MTMKFKWFPSTKSEESSISDGWFKRIGEGGKVYYTPYFVPKVTRFVINKGDTVPTPSELANWFNKHPDDTLANGGYMARYEYEKTEEQAIPLPPGVYNFYGGSFSQPPSLEPMQLRTDTYIPVTTIYNPMAIEMRKFLEATEVYRDQGVLHRLGMLLIGPPGNGKTTLIRELVHREFPEDGVTIFMRYLPDTDFLALLDKTTKGRMKLCIFEELAAQLERQPLEPLLNFLDGELSMDDTINIATTNYPQYLPRSLLDRTSRFDLLFYMGNPSAEERREFLAQYSGEEIPVEVVDGTNDMSISDLKEIVLSAKRRGQTLAQAVAVLQERKKVVADILDGGKRYI